MSHNEPLSTSASHTDNQNETERYQQIKAVTIIGAVINIVLAIAKVLFGYLFHSQSLIADGIHSFSDLASDALVLYAAKHSSREADEKHPYGHGRFETVVTVGLGLLLFAVAGGIAFDAFRRLIEPDALLKPGLVALLVAVLSVLSKEFLYHYTLRIGNRVRSNMLRANAWHHRSDAVSSLVVIVGIAGTMMGFHFLDAIAAIGVAAMIAKIGWDISIQSIRELVDTALAPEQIEVIREEILSVPGVEKLHMLRTRQMAGNALVDVHIQVDPTISVSEGHFISESVRTNLLKNIDEVTDVMVHIDSEDDENPQAQTSLPTRSEIVEALRNSWKEVKYSETITRVNLHYLNGQIDVELLLPLEALPTIQEAKRLANTLSDTISQVAHIGKITILFHGAQ